MVLVPVVTRMLRPAAKAMLKGGITMYRQSGIAEATDDLFAEVRSEIDRDGGGAGDERQRRAPVGAAPARRQTFLL